MQFSIIVEGPMDSNACNEDDLLELERFLTASDISSGVLEELKKGQPQILKNELSYEQAVKISDRLFDLGLDSIIDPPIKPDDDDDDTYEASHTKGPTQINVKKIVPNPALAVVSSSTTKVPPINTPAINARVQLGHRKGITTSQAKQNYIREHFTEGKPVPRQSALKASVQTVSRNSQNEITTAKIPAKPKQVSSNARMPPTRPNPTQLNRPSLNKAAADVKSLFRLPKEGKLDLPLPAMARFKAIMIAIACSAVLTLYGAIWLVIFGLSLSLSIIIFNATVTASIIFGVLFGSIPLLLFSGLFALTHLPFFLARQSDKAELELRAKDQPRLFMLASAIGKVLGTPAPKFITLNNSSHLRARQTSSFKDFLNFKEPLSGDIKLDIGIVLIRCLSVQELCSLIAKELGNYSKPQLRRSQWIIQNTMRFTGFCKTPHDELKKRLCEYDEKNQLAFLHKSLSLLSNLSDSLHNLACAYFSHGHALLKSCIGLSDPIGIGYQQAFLGNDAVEDLVETLIHIEANHELALEEMQQNKDKGRYVNNLIDYSQFLLDKNQSKSNRPAKSKSNVQTSAIVSSIAPMHRLVEGFNHYEQALTKLTYQRMGLKLDEIELCSLKSLFQHEANDQKLGRAATDYFSGWQHPLQFWRLPAENILPNGGTDSVINRLNNCIARIRYVAPERQSSLQRYDKLLKQYAEMKAAKKIMASGNTFDFQRCGESVRTLDRDLNLRKVQLRETQDELRQHNAIMGERLALGLMLNKQQKELSIRLVRALSMCNGVADKAAKLMAAIEELNHILRHKPKNQLQQFQVYTRELTEIINDTDRAIRKRLLNCPYDMIDRRYANMAQFISAQQHDHDSLNLNHEHLIINRAKDTLAALNWAYKQLNQRAAFIALSMEKQFGVETVKRLEGSNN